MLGVPLLHFEFHPARLFSFLHQWSPGREILGVFEISQFLVSVIAEVAKENCEQNGDHQFRDEMVYDCLS